MSRVAVLFSLLSLCEGFFPRYGPRLLSWKRRSDFEEENNWSLGRTPCNGDVITFLPGLKYFVTLHQDFLVYKMVFSEHTKISFVNDLGISATYEKDPLCPSERIEFSKRNVFDPSNWATHNEPLTFLHNEQVPCNGDVLLLGAPEELFILDGLPITLAQLRINLFSYVSVNISTSSTMRSFLNDMLISYDIRINFDELKFDSHLCDEGCSCAHSHKKLTDTIARLEVCDHTTCPHLHCTKPLLAKSQCCQACVLDRLYALKDGCPKFDNFYNKMGAVLTTSSLFKEYQRYGNLSIAYVENRKAQVTFTSLNDLAVEYAHKLIALLPDEDDCYKLEHEESSFDYIEKEDEKKVQKKSSSHKILGVSLFFLFFFLILLTSLYIFRHTIRIRYLPRLRSHWEGLVARLSNSGVAGVVEMKGHMIFNNDAVFDDSSVNEDVNDHTFGKIRDKLVENDFLEGTSSSKEKSAFSNLAYEDNQVTEVIKKKDGKKKKKESKEEKKNETDSFENPFFSI